MARTELIFTVSAEDLDYRLITLRRLEALEKLGDGAEEWVGAFHNDSECSLRVYDDGANGRIVQRSAAWSGSGLDLETTDELGDCSYYLTLKHARPSKSETKFDAKYGIETEACLGFQLECEFHLAADCPIAKAAARLRRKRRSLGTTFPAYARSLAALRALGADAAA
jgi:hypothetical protein